MTYTQNPYLNPPAKNFWLDIAQRLLSCAPRTNYEILVPDEFHPGHLPDYFARDIGIEYAPRGHWRSLLGTEPGAPGLHVLDQDGRRMLVHWDEVCPLGTIEARVEHARRDTPVVYHAGCVAAGAAIGHLLDKKSGAASGALVGLVVSVLTAAPQAAEPRPSL